MQYLPSPVDDVLLCFESDCSIIESNYQINQIKLIKLVIVNIINTYLHQQYHLVIELVLDPSHVTLHKEYTNIISLNTNHALTIVSLYSCS